MGDREAVGVPLPLAAIVKVSVGLEGKAVGETDAEGVSEAQAVPEKEARGEAESLSLWRGEAEAGAEAETLGEGRAETLLSGEAESGGEGVGEGVPAAAVAVAGREVRGEREGGGELESAGEPLGVLEGSGDAEGLREAPSEGDTPVLPEGVLERAAEGLSSGLCEGEAVAAGVALPRALSLTEADRAPEGDGRLVPAAEVEGAPLLEPDALPKREKEGGAEPVSSTTVSVALAEGRSEARAVGEPPGERDALTEPESEPPRELEARAVKEAAPVRVGDGVAREALAAPLRLLEGVSTAVALPAPEIVPLPEGLAEAGALAEAPVAVGPADTVRGVVPDNEAQREAEAQPLPDREGGPEREGEGLPLAQAVWVLDMEAATVAEPPRDTVCDTEGVNGGEDAMGVAEGDGVLASFREEEALTVVDGEVAADDEGGALAEGTEDGDTGSLGKGDEEGGAEALPLALRIDRVAPLDALPLAHGAADRERTTLPVAIAVAESVALDAAVLEKHGDVDALAAADAVAALPDGRAERVGSGD